MEIDEEVDDAEETEQTTPPPKRKRKAWVWKLRLPILDDALYERVLEYYWGAGARGLLRTRPHTNEEAAEVCQFIERFGTKMCKVWRQEPMLGGDDRWRLALAESGKLLPRDCEIAMIMKQLFELCWDNDAQETDAHVQKDRDEVRLMLMEQMGLHYVLINSKYVGSGCVHH